MARRQFIEVAASVMFWFVVLVLTLFVVVPLMERLNEEVRTRKAQDEAARQQRLREDRMTFEEKRAALEQRKRLEAAGVLPKDPLGDRVWINPGGGPGSGDPRPEWLRGGDHPLAGK